LLSCSISRFCSTIVLLPASSCLFLFFCEPPPTDIYTLSLHDALPILSPRREREEPPTTTSDPLAASCPRHGASASTTIRQRDFRCRPGPMTSGSRRPSCCWL